MRLKTYVCFALVLFLLASFAFPQAEVKGIKIEIYASKMDIFDAASQVLIEKGFALLTTNERVGLITTDYIKAEESFGTSLLLSLFGKKDIEIMLSTNIVGVGNKCTLSIFPKARVKKDSRLKVEYQEMTLSDKSVKGFYSIGDEIKVLAEGGSVAPPAAEVSRPTETISPPRGEVGNKPLKKSGKEINVNFIRVKVATANVRNAPSMSGAVINKASVGTEYRVIGIEGDWYEIVLNESQTGYMSNMVCELFEKAIIAEQYEDIREAAEEVPSERIRENPERQVYRPGRSPSETVGEDEEVEKNLFFGLGAGLLFIMSDVNELLPVGFGIDFNAYYRLLSRIYLTAGLSSYYFPGKEDWTMARIQPMVGIQYRYPISRNMIIFGGLSIGLAIDVLGWSYHDYSISDTYTGFATDFVFGFRMNSFYLNPRIRLVGHEGDSFSSFDIAFGFIF